jgi:hypothetical protein
MHAKTRNVHKDYFMLFNFWSTHIFVGEHMIAYNIQFSFKKSGITFH